jgi:peptide/nickel transport system ATP-binding protein/oligopeptide transport system ATP-binding protein
MEPLLQVQDLKTYFYTEDGVGKAVDGISFDIGKDWTLGIVGESGCGKSVTALSIMGLVRSPPGKIVAGSILYHGRKGVVDIAREDPKGEKLRSLRGNEMAMIFQEPMTSLNPVFTVGDQIVEAVSLHQGLGRKDAKARAVEMLRAVGIQAPEKRVDSYPHEMSGGMRQRAMIAMALSCNPSLLIADEPTTALDVTIQAQVLELMEKLKVEFRTSLLFITHDLGVVANIADEVIVMYLGKIVEKAPVRELFTAPRHPYTRGLLDSLPSTGKGRARRLVPIPGVVPNPFDTVTGCVFRERCPLAAPECALAMPGLREAGPGHLAACFRTF